MASIRIPCETCEERDHCPLAAEFRPRFVFRAIIDGRLEGCREYRPVWYRGLEGCLP